MEPKVSVTAHGELYHPTRYPDIKDPSPVFDGRRWHLFGTGCGLPDGLEILHATAPRLDGPWLELPPVVLHGVDHIASPAAPGVVAEGRRLHLFLQHEFNVLGGHVEHLVSDDGGRSFTLAEVALESLPGTGEAGIYDPDPAEVGGERYLTYAGMSVVGEPDLYLARSTSGTWHGPWERVGRILGHEDVEGHNQVGEDDYEWGLEGPQLVELPSGRCLLTAVAFMAGHARGHRQRVLLADAPGPAGPYRVLGPVVDPRLGAGENGHGSAVVAGGGVELIYQERAGDGLPWRVLRASLEHPDWVAPAAGARLAS